jgi:hypothetical protein
VARMKPFTLGLHPEEIRATAEPLRLGETSGTFNGWVRGSEGAPAWGFPGVAQRVSPRLRL